jgi:hypothetical protein
MLDPLNIVPSKPTRPLSHDFSMHLRAAMAHVEADHVVDKKIACDLELAVVLVE